MSKLCTCGVDDNVGHCLKSNELQWQQKDNYAKPYAMPMPPIPVDQVIERVIVKLKDRSRVGFKKYKMSMSENRLSNKEWLVNLQEELMDAVNYIERLLQEE